MSPIFEFFFGQYRGYETHIIGLEVAGIVFGLISSICSMRNSVWVYPTGIVSTLIFVYILLKFNLLGDTIINGYYFVMSIYGWYIWTRKVTPTQTTPITKATKNDYTYSLGIFLSTMLFIYIIYYVFEKFEGWVSYIDILTTGLFFVGMWMLAKKKLENWLFLLMGNVISVPLYFYKGLTLSSFLYVIFVIISIFGYLAWKKILNNRLQTA
ncbi:nicotinamide riboside transporter PnuC [Croceibacter atlanticus]|jgi:nicotinamide mononucleotide transporter|uniref:nicotinamide riboside transporter PnuC n=1 Tax=Croceibacter atlanticus TaxID=313588 RepID=UPI000E7E6FFF|nr:nicotinamide mononucleotide transporter [Flavobacteriaceae bacterium]|tara:strand:+ start:6260 stop:6892 length:633 start_codon:yes stop_codon:yes gene_type:complete